MNSWKSINLSRQYGDQALFLMSLIAVLISFITVYTLLSPFYFGTAYSDDHAAGFILLVVLLYPVHKLLHYLPLFILHGRDKICFVIFRRWMPLVRIKIGTPISKLLFLSAQFMPFSIVTSALGCCMMFLPRYRHYFTILLALHTGLCLKDFIRAKHLSGSPEGCCIEVHEDGFDILTASK